jgi:hypothetical protein
MPSRILLMFLLLFCLDARATDPQQTNSSDSNSPNYDPPLSGAPNYDPLLNDKIKSSVANTPHIDEKATDKATCRAKWDRYYRSQECLVPYRYASGVWKPGAFENCPVFAMPDECPPLSPQEWKDQQ